MNSTLKIISLTLLYLLPTVSLAQNNSSQANCDEEYANEVSNIQAAYLNCLDLYLNVCNDVNVCSDQNCLDACDIGVSTCVNIRDRALTAALNQHANCILNSNPSPRPPSQPRSMPHFRRSNLFESGHSIDVDI